VARVFRLVRVVTPVLVVLDVNRLDLAVEAALAAGVVLKDLRQQRREIELKAIRDFVTDADRRSEEEIVSRLRRADPGSTIVTEEAGGVRGDPGVRWIVDPLDGTLNYMHGYGAWCIAIACEIGQEITHGVVYAPLRDELYIAERGAGATLNGVRMVVSATADISDAFLCTGFGPRVATLNGQIFAQALTRVQAVRSDGSAALGIANVAAGRFDGYWEYDLKIWDRAAAALIVEEAGGDCIHVERTGEQFSLTAASNAALLQQLLALVGSGS